MLKQPKGMLGIVLLLIASIIWSSTPIFVKFAYEELSPFFLAEARLIIATIFFLLISKPKISKEIFYLAFFGLGANYLFYHLGLLYTTSPVAQSIESMAPLFVLTLVILKKSEKITRSKVSAVFLSFFGSLLIFHAHSSFNYSLLLGDFFEIFAAISWAYFIVKSKILLYEKNIFQLLSSAFLLSAIIFFPFYFYDFAKNSSFLIFSHISLNSVAIILILSFFHSFLAYFIYYEGIKRSSAILAGIIFALNPVFTLVFSRAFLEEFINLEIIVGMAFITIAVVLASLKE